MKNKTRNALALAVLTVAASYAAMAQNSSASSTQPQKTASAASPAPADDRNPAGSTTVPMPLESSHTVDDEITTLKKRIEVLEIEVRNAERPASNASARDAAALMSAEKEMMGEPHAALAAATAPAQSGGVPVSPAAPTRAASTPAAPVAPTPKDPHAPAFSDWDWTWLNGNPRNKDTAWDSKFFTPEIRADVTYNYDFNRPKDDTMSGSSELFRTSEIQLEQLGLGGDFHLDNVHARFMTQFGMYSTATVRNDPSYSKGQWDIADADRYLSEAYGGYQIPNVMHGINIDAGIFMSYVGLFSYYNFDNWAYQPSFVSSNTPWFFQGIRIQIFPTEHLKIEPWIINGWQSYGTSNSRKGLGGQIKYTPKPWINIISNNYGMGHDDFEVPGRSRIHTDNSVEVKYFDRPTAQGIDKMAFSLTGDLGCEYGAGVNCHNDKNGNFKQSFVGYMVYDRTWFKKDLFGLTIGGGQINNPGEYLVLVPPINGETATTAALNSPYFQMNPGDPFKAWDGTVTFDYMPKEWFTWRWEYGYRHSNVPYWNGRGGMTPPAFAGAAWGVNNNSPTQFACMDGSAVPDPSGPYTSGTVPYGTTGTGAPGFAASYCGTSSSGPHGGVWYPDLRRDEQYIDIDLMVKF